MESTTEREMASASAPTPVTASAQTDESFKLYLPSVHEKTSAKKIFAVMANLGIGRLGRADGGDAIEITDHVSRSDGRPFKTAVVHFKHPFTRGEDGEQNKAALEHLRADPDNFIAVEHMPEKTKEDGTVLPARVWRARLDRPRAPRPAAPGQRPTLVFGRQERKPKAQMLETDDDWGDDVVSAPGVTEDEAREAVQAAAAAAAPDEADVAEDDAAEGQTELTDEQYAEQVMAGGSA